MGQTYNFFKRSRCHIGLSIQKKGLYIDKEIGGNSKNFTFSVLITYDELGVTFHNRKIRTITEHKYIYTLKSYYPFGYNLSYYEFLRA